MAQAMAVPRSSMMVAAAGRVKPARMSANIASGDSVRGLSLVITAVSARRSAMRPMIGRFPASRSPPQPNTHQSRP